jgi:hypothetical protein
MQNQNTSNMKQKCQNYPAAYHRSHISKNSLYSEPRVQTFSYSFKGRSARAGFVAQPLYVHTFTAPRQYFSFMCLYCVLTNYVISDSTGGEHVIYHMRKYSNLETTIQWTQYTSTHSSVKRTKHG